MIPDEFLLRTFEREGVMVREYLVPNWGGSQQWKMVWDSGLPPRPLIHMDFPRNWDKKEVVVEGRRLCEEAFDNCNWSRWESLVRGNS